MRRTAILVAVLGLAPVAHAAPPAISVQSSPATGAAPLAVTLTAGGDAAAYHWDLGDGATADGQVVQHVYGPGLFVARLTATGLSGETAQAGVTITSLALTLGAPRVGGFRQLLRFHGRLVPGLKGVRVGLYRGDRRIASVKTTRGGRFQLRGRIGAPVSQYTARCGGAVSKALALTVRPRVETAFIGSGQVGRPLGLTVRERPATAGVLKLRIWQGRRLWTIRSGHGLLRVHLDTQRSLDYRMLVTVTPAKGYAPCRLLLQRIVYVARLGPGDSGTSVYALEQRLNELRFALGRVDGYYGVDTSDAVVAFQKLHGLPRTGWVDARFWRELESAHVPVARNAGDHVEVSKERQVLFLVRGGHVTLVVPVSTGATGNTPVGVWHVYSKVPGWNGVLWYPMFFVGSFAIHGYPEVPYYPASHGCVRVPMWVAPRLFSLNAYGTTVYIY